MFTLHNNSQYFVIFVFSSLNILNDKTLDFLSHTLTSKPTTTVSWIWFFLTVNSPYSQKFCCITSQQTESANTEPLLLGEIQS